MSSQTETEYGIEDIKLQGDWEVSSAYVRHKTITATLNDYLEVSFYGSDCRFRLSSQLGKKIAAVVTLNNLPLTPDLAGDDILYGEGQSFIFVDELRDYQLIKNAPLDTHILRIATRSNKLTCYSFITG